MIRYIIKHMILTLGAILSSLLVLSLSTTVLFAHKIDPYDRDTAYIGGLSRQLFNVDRNDITSVTKVREAQLQALRELKQEHQRLLK